MRRIRAADFEPPLHDGSITDGRARQPAGPPRLRLDNTAFRIRQTRAMLLPLCVEVLGAIDRVVILDEYGASALGQRDIALRQRIDSILSDVSPTDKIERVRPILRHLYRKHAEMVIYRLFEASRLFHALITRPIFLLKSDLEDLDEEDFELCIADEQFVWSIDEEQLDEWQRLLSRCRQDLEAASAMLLGEAASVGGV